MPLRYTLGDQSWLQDDLTVAEVSAIEKHLGVAYTELRPVANMTHRWAILASFLSREKGEKEALDQIGAMGYRELDDCLSWQDDDDLPTEFVDGLPLDGDPSADSSTDGSSTAPEPTDGLPALPEPNLSET